MKEKISFREFRIWSDPPRKLQIKGGRLLSIDGNEVEFDSQDMEVMLIEREKFLKICDDLAIFRAQSA